MSSRASRGMGMGMEKTGLGVDLLEELLARHRRREQMMIDLYFAGITRRGGISHGDVLESEDTARSRLPIVMVECREIKVNQDTAAC